MWRDNGVFDAQTWRDDEVFDAQMWRHDNVFDTQMWRYDEEFDAQTWTGGAIIETLTDTCLTHKRDLLWRTAK